MEGIARSTLGRVPRFLRTNLLLWLGLLGTARSAMPAPDGAVRLFPHGREAPSGWTRITNDPFGIRIDGSVRCAEPMSAPVGEAEDPDVGDRLDVWLAPRDAVAFPDPGWGNQFGEHALDPKLGCKEFATRQGGVDSCRAWVRRLPEYRRLLRKVFVSRWEITADSSRETWLTPHLGKLASRYLSGHPDHWEGWFLPRDVPRVDSFRSTDTSFEFSVLLRWGAMPPSKSWKMDRTRIAVEVSCRGGGDSVRSWSGTTRKPIEGIAGRIPRVKLDPAPRWRFTACSLPPVGRSAFGDDRDLWFHPDANSIVDSGFMIHNPAAGYLHVPSGIAPILEAFGRFSTSISPGRFVCGPSPVGHGDGDRRWVSNSLEFCASSGSELRIVDVGSRKLLIDGPDYSTSGWGSGQCGACDRLCFQVFELPNRGAPKRLFVAPYEIFGDESDLYDIQWSPDHRRFTILSNKTRGSEAPDSLVRLDDFCMGRSAFEPCGKQRTQRGLGTPRTPWMPYDQRGSKTGTP